MYIKNKYVCNDISILYINIWNKIKYVCIYLMFVLNKKS